MPVSPRPNVASDQTLRVDWHTCDDDHLLKRSYQRLSGVMKSLILTVDLPAAFPDSTHLGLADIVAQKLLLHLSVLAGFVLAHRPAHNPADFHARSPAVFLVPRLRQEERLDLDLGDQVEILLHAPGCPSLRMLIFIRFPYEVPLSLELLLDHEPELG